MQPISRFETPPSDPGTRLKLQALVAELRRGVQLLSSDISEQESGAGSRSHVASSPLARNLIARRDNLLATIRMLEDRLVKTEVAA